MLDPIPQDVQEIFSALEQDPTVYNTMYVSTFDQFDLSDDCLTDRNGPSEFHITGSLKTWTVVDDLHKINVPTLLLNGKYDEAQDSVVLPFFRAIQKVKWYTFAESSHMPQYEEREKFIQVVGDFLVSDL